MQLKVVDQAVEEMPESQARPTAWLRIRGLLILTPCVILLSLSVWLRPQADGYGTHRELGLPACGFLTETGYPCPSCGMTTAFANMAHGHLEAAFLAQPFGVVLFAVVVGFAVVGIAEAVTGRDALHYMRPGPWWAVVALSGTMLGWGFKIAYGLSTGILPVH